MNREQNDIAIRVSNLSKCYHIYDTPRDRLKQFVLPRVQRTFGKQARNYFKEFWALKDISFEVKKGETVGIIGRNGSGKSTLLQMICGTLNPSGGDLQTHGRIAALLELGSGFNPDFTGRENVYMNAAVLGLSPDETAARYADIVAFADIGDFMDQPVKTYSSGMVVRLAFAVAVNTDPQILIIDEALSVGDELFQRKCFARIEAIKSKGTTILFVSHSGSTVVELCDRAVLLDAGEKLAVGEPKVVVGIYQKLLYAPRDAQQAIRAEIPAMLETSRQEIRERDTGSAHPADFREESFDPHLAPDSTIEFASNGARIHDPIITTVDGRAVNSLKPRRKYIYSYRVRFDRPVANVRFGMVIKTTTGFSLGGAHSTRMRDSIPLVAAGTTISVRFSFECSLNPGTYFMNAGAFGAIDDEEIVLHRIVDAMVFRVTPPEYDLATEAVDFNCVADITIHE